MSLDDLKRVNRLWRKVYPYLAAQIMEEYRRDSGVVLELGPFSGGISQEMARLYTGLNITIADKSPAVVDYLRQEISEARLSHRIKVEQTGFGQLAFHDGQFDLVICRGAFFFLSHDLLREMFRVLKSGGIAFVGGGFGKGTPQELIAEIEEESRELNLRLGRKRVSKQELEQMFGETGLTASCRVVEEGGLWLSITRFQYDM